MQVGDLVKMKSAPAHLSFGPARRGGLGLILEDAHRTKRGPRECTVLWSEHPHPNANCEDIQDIPEAWLEVVQ
jgi:hypothetical protein